MSIFNVFDLNLNLGLEGKIRSQVVKDKGQPQQYLFHPTQPTWLLTIVIAGQILIVGSAVSAVFFCSIMSLLRTRLWLD